MTLRIHARYGLALLAALVLVVVVPAAAIAHAELVRAIPADGETVADPVTVLSGRYSEDLTGNSNLRVLDATGATVATGGIDPENPRRMIARPDPPLTNGTYTVQSTTISAEDGDIDRTSWTFTVAIAATPSPTTSPTPATSEAPSAATSATPAVTPSPSVAPSPSPTASLEPGSDTTGDSTSVVLPILAALAIVAIGAGFLLRRGRGTGPTG